MGEHPKVEFCLDDVAGGAVFVHATAALTTLRAEGVRLPTLPWSIVHAALAADAARSHEVAAACGVTGSEVAAGLRSWAARQRQAGLISEVELGVANLLARGVDGPRCP